MRYYRILDDLNAENRWWLGNLVLSDEVNFWDYLRTKEIVPPPKALEMEMQETGEPLDITMAAFEVLVVNEKGKQLFSNRDFQFIPVSIKSQESGSKYYVMVTLFEEDCVDEAKSEFERYERDDEIRPDLAGKYSGFFKLVIDTSKQYSHAVFRVKDYNVAIIVNEEIKSEYERLNLTGLKFIDVT